MTQDIWIGMAQDAKAAWGWRFDGVTPRDAASGRNAQDVLAALQASAATVMVQDGRSSHAVPAPVLAEDPTLLCDLTQTRPRGHLPATARLRIAGVLAARPNWDGVICLALPEATHWCQISANEIISFQSALTPHLAKALGGGGKLADPDALADTMSRPERLSIHLRSATLADDPSAVIGHLLGAELAAMRPYWLGQQVISVAQDSLYSDALSAQGVPVETVAPEKAMCEGLVALRGKSA